MDPEDSEIIIRNDLDYILDLPYNSGDLYEEIDECVNISEAELEEDTSDDEVNTESISADEEQNEKFNIPGLYQDLDTFSNNDLLDLREEEQEVINKCSDPNLKQILIANRFRSIHLTGMCRNYFKAIEEINKLITKQKKVIYRKSKNGKKAKKYFKSDMKCGMPYFKDKSTFGAYKNKDHTDKMKNGEHFVAKCTEGPRWTIEEQNILCNAVTQDYYKYRKKQLSTKENSINQFLKNETKDEETTELMKTLQKSLEEQMLLLNSEKPKIPPSLDCDQNVIDWERIAVIELKGKRTPQESRGMWNNYVHPQINKTNWTNQENEKIKELVLKYRNDWDLIAKKLGTNRSPYLIFVHFKTNLYDAYKRGRFQPKEDKILMSAVEKCRLGDYIPWSRVKHFCTDRAKYQLYHRYKYYLQPKNIKKGSFTEAEDVLLAYLVKSTGKEYANIAQLVPNRTSIQLRNRYTTYLEKVRFNLGSFTIEEDKIILDHVNEHGELWRALANKLNRCRAHVRQRYLTLKRTLEKNPDFTLRDIARRKQYFLTAYQKARHERLKKCLSILEKFDGVPTLKSVELILQNIARNAKDRKWKVNKCTKTYTKTQSGVEKDLMEYFKITHKMEQSKNNNIESDAIDATAISIITLINTFGGDINIFNNNINELCNYLTIEEKVVINNIVEKCDIMNYDVTSPNVVAIPGTSSQSQFNSINGDKNEHAFYLPPNINSLALVRGLLLYFNMHHNKEPTGIQPPQKVYHRKAPEENKIVRHDGNSITEKETRFKNLLNAIFKWPGILSEYFPESELDEEEIILEKQEIPRKRGRPPKRIYAKVLKMIEAKRKRQQETNLNTANNETSIENEETVPSTIPPKRKRGRPRKQDEILHEVAYIPKRCHVKPEGGAVRDYKSKKVCRDDLHDTFKDKSPSSTSVRNDESPVVETNANIVQNKINNDNSDTQHGTPIILKKVDPRMDKRLRELLKGKVKLVPSAVNKTNNCVNVSQPPPENNLQITSQNKEKEIIVYSRKRPRNSVEDVVIGNKKPRLENEIIPTASTKNKVTNLKNCDDQSTCNKINLVSRNDRNNICTDNNDAYSLLNYSFSANSDESLQDDLETKQEMDSDLSEEEPDAPMMQTSEILQKISKHSKRFSSLKTTKSRNKSK